MENDKNNIVMPEDKNTIIFRMGEETGIVIEKENFKQSLFREHYTRALQLVNDIISGSQEASSNVIAFCADRGEGKTSCMLTVANLLSNKQLLQKCQKELDIKNEHSKLNPDKIECLDLIDPAFFDEKHNIVELVTGMMYEKVRNQEKYKDRTISQNVDLVARFREVQKALEYIEKSSMNDMPLYDPLEKVQTLSQGLTLKKMITELISAYLTFIKKDYLVICIDDIDLNIQYAYRMTEQLRKYLSNDKCLILFATNIEQLTIVIRHSMEKELYGTIINSDESICQEMAAKYITKMLPTSHRINLVHIADLYDKPLDLLNTEGHLEKHWNRAKEAITQLIYERTRYLFYNNESETSLIVPTNLRSFRHLMKLLTDMPIYHNVQIRKDLYQPTPEEELQYSQGITNKTTFKNYFYQDWVSNNLTEEDANWVDALVNYPNVSGLNKLVIQYFKKRFSQFLDFGSGAENKTIKAIVDSIKAENSRTYNITVGDVFYYISLLESELTDRNDKNLVFFIKSFYSMRMYEYYDVITENQGTLCPKVQDEDAVNIYPIDTRFSRTNILQRFVNGSFFTYSPGDFMAKDEGTKLQRDLHVYVAKNFRSLYKNVIEHFQEFPNEKEDEWILKLNICEFLLWTMARKGSFEDKQSDMVVDRSNVQPLYFGEYSTSAIFFTFDVMAPFYNATNIEYAYNRMSKYVEDEDAESEQTELVVNEDAVEKKLSFYDIAKSNTSSLLHLAIAHANKYNDNPDAKEDKEIKLRFTTDDYDKRLNVLLSQSVIRNADVLISLYIQLTDRRSLNRRMNKDILVRLEGFYNDLRKANMSTYETVTDSNYGIRFAFSDALVDFLKQFNEKEIKNSAKEFRKPFIKILTTTTTVAESQNQKAKGKK